MLAVYDYFLSYGAMTERIAALPPTKENPPFMLVLTNDVLFNCFSLTVPVDVTQMCI